jgi:hypothetical protein
MHQLTKEMLPKRIIFALAGALCIAATGCSTIGQTSLPPSEQTRQQFGVVGVRVIGDSPKYDFDTPVRGRSAGAAQGAGRGAFQGVDTALQTGDGLSAAIALVVLVPLGIIVGGIEGANAAVPEEQAKRIDATIASVFSDVPIAPEVRHGLTQALDERVRQPFKMLTDESNGNVDTILEVSVHRAGLAGGKGSNPILTVFVEAEIKLVRTSDETIIHEDKLLKQSGARTLVEWTKNDAASLRRSLKMTYQHVGEEVVEEVFLVWRPSS